MTDGRQQISRQSEANQAKAGAAILSVVSNVTLVALKYAVGIATGSAAIISEGTHSLTDLVASGLAWIAVRKAAKPADATHPFGHEKYESVSGLAEGVLIILAAFWIVNAAAVKWRTGAAVEHFGWGLVLMAVSCAVNVVVSARLHRVAHNTDSLALHADANNRRSDVLTSAGVFLGLLLAWGTHWRWVDPVVAIGVAGAIVVTGLRVVFQSLDHLLDHALPPSEEAAIERLLHEHAGQFEEFHDLRTRKAGNVRHIDLHLVMDGRISLQEAHDLTDHLERDLQTLLPGAQVIIHTEPHTEAQGRAARPPLLP